jgi:hypothetical protein
MIPYADLERAIARWKMRQAGGEQQAEQPTHEVGGEAVLAEAYAEEMVVVNEPSGLTVLGAEEE